MSNWIIFYERGKAALRQKRLREARRYFRKAETLVEFESNPVLAGTLFMRMGGTEMQFRDYHAASRALTRSIAIAEEHLGTPEGRKLYVSSLTLMSCMTALQGQVEEAQKSLQELVARIEEFDERILAAEPLEALADMHLGRGNSQRAETLFKQAFELRSKFEPMGWATNLLSDRLIDVCLLNENFDEADRLRERNGDLVREFVVSDGDPEAIKVIEEYDELKREKKLLKADAIISQAIKIELGTIRR